MATDNSTTATTPIAQREPQTKTAAQSHAGSPITLRSYALAAVARRAYDAPTSASELPEAQFLLGYLRAVGASETEWAVTLTNYLSRPLPADAALIHLAEELNLTLVEILTVALAAAVEDDVMVGRALAHLQAPLGGSRPTLGLLATSLLGREVSGGQALDALLTGAAISSGLLTLTNEGAPLPERAVAMPLHLCLALHGHDGTWPGTVIGRGEVPPVPLPPTIVQEAQRQALGLSSGAHQALVLRTNSVAEGRAVAAEIASTLHGRALFIETDKTVGLGPWLILRRLLPVFCFDLAPGERKTLPSLPGYRGPVLALCGPDGSIETAGGSAVSWSLPVPPREEREQLWQAALGNHELAATLARYHRHGSGRIAHLGRLAHYHSAIKGQTQPGQEEVLAASWIGEGSGLNALAQPLTHAVPDEALVMTPTLRAELHTLLLRCHARDSLVQGLGASATSRYCPGVRALFVGPSGTGKTLAAGWLATKLGLPLYRVDLAAITSKYIGETEKNLAQLLARAEQAEVVLLFDEADSMFGKRTDVKEANDRFANAQTNYLLQRIESFDGITLLTSNSRSRFDASFSRRLDLIIDFPLPGPEERRLLWLSHLGTNHRLAQPEINQIAVTADLGGGHIRNAVLTAAVLAQAAARPIEYNDVVQGLIGEYRKLGRQMPVELKLKS
jgi:hypothetical protein